MDKLQAAIETGDFDAARAALRNNEERETFDKLRAQYGDALGFIVDAVVTDRTAQDAAKAEVNVTEARGAHAKACLALVIAGTEPDGSDVIGAIELLRSQYPANGKDGKRNGVYNKHNVALSKIRKAVAHYNGLEDGGWLARVADEEAQAKGFHGLTSTKVENKAQGQRKADENVVSFTTKADPDVPALETEAWSPARAEPFAEFVASIDAAKATLESMASANAIGAETATQAEKALDGLVTLVRNNCLLMEAKHGQTEREESAA